MENKLRVNINIIALVGSVIITIVGAVTSYFNALSEIRKEIALSAHNERKESRENYANKEEVRNLQFVLQEIKSDLKTVQREIVVIGTRNEYFYKANTGRRGSASESN